MAYWDGISRNPDGTAKMTSEQGDFKNTASISDYLQAYQTQNGGAGADDGFAANIAADQYAQEQYARLAGMGRKVGLTGTDQQIAESMHGIREQDTLFNPDIKFGLGNEQYTLGKNVDWSKFSRGDFMDKMAPALFGGAMMAFGLPPMAIGAMTGGVNASENGGNLLTGMFKGGLAGYAGGQIAKGVGGMANTSATGDNAMMLAGQGTAGGAGTNWGSYAPYIKSLTGAATGATKSAIGGNNILQGALTGGLSGAGVPGPLAGMAAGQLLGGSGTPNTGGNMADNSISDWAKMLSPFVSAGNTWNQAGNTQDTYDKAYNLITTPSADQQKYRTQLDTLMSNPGSIESSPLYQSLMDSGMNNVNRTAAAAGMLGSGNRLAELMKVGQDSASKYYFPQQQALAGLSNIAGDSGQRTLGAQALISGQGAQNQLSTSMLNDLMSGVGVKSQEQQMIDAILGRNSGNQGTGGVNLGGVANTIGDWFSGMNTGNYSDSSSIMPYIDPWGSSGSTSGVDLSSYFTTPDYTQSAFDMNNWNNWF